MNPTKRLWITLGVILFASFAVLGWMGREIHFAQPPIPDAVRSADGELLYTRADYDRGREVWQSIGGQQLGSIWGHGGYVAPDWSADWLHREAVGLLDRWSLAEDAVAYAAQPAERQAALQARLRVEMRTNTYAANGGVLTVSEDRAAVIREVATHYQKLFSDDPALRTLRDQYAIAENAIPDAGHRAAMTAFFFWSSWATVTNRPGKDISYTQNWPHEPLVGNGPTPAAFMWTVASIVFLLAGVGALAWHHAATRHSEPAARPPQTDPLATMKITPSMRASAKFFWLAIALFGVQVLLGAITAHYAVEGQAFYGFELSQILPYSLSRTWHTQLSVLWIATAWLGAGLFGFLINPPLALYYMQGLNTPLHGHTALFGVYGMLGIGLMLFCLRGLAPRLAWNDGLLKTTFWSLNLGLAGVALLSLLPIGVLQVKASVEHGFWYARSAEFVHDPLIETLVWMRVPGDVVFSIGVLTLTWFVLRLYVGPRRRARVAVDAGGVAALG